MTRPGGLRKTRRIALAGVAAGAAGALAGSVAVVSVADSDAVLVWVQIVGVVATVAAAFLAFWTILSAKRQAKESQDALIRERRIDFELDVLRDLAELNLKPVAGPDTRHRMKLLTAMLTVDLVPVSRAFFDLPTTPSAERSVRRPDDQPHGHHEHKVQKLMQTEILAAIERLVNARG